MERQTKRHRKDEKDDSILLCPLECFVSFTSSNGKNLSAFFLRIRSTDAFDKTKKALFGVITSTCTVEVNWCAGRNDLVSCRVSRCILDASYLQDAIASIRQPFGPYGVHFLTYETPFIYM